MPEIYTEDDEVLPEIDTHLVESLIKQIGLEPTENLIDQLCVFLQALKLHDNRTKVYGLAFKKRGWLWNLFNMIHKSDRIEAKFFPPSENWMNQADPLGDVYDLINYCAFFIRTFDGFDKLVELADFGQPRKRYMKGSTVRDVDDEASGLIGET